MALALFAGPQAPDDPRKKLNDLLRTIILSQSQVLSSAQGDSRLNQPQSYIPTTWSEKTYQDLQQRVNQLSQDPLIRSALMLYMIMQMRQSGNYQLPPLNFSF